jgi:hypothetical protein
MGRPDEQKGGKTLAVSVDINGAANYDAILRQGQRANKVIHSGHQALVPKVDLLDPQVGSTGETAVCMFAEVVYGLGFVSGRLQQGLLLGISICAACFASQAECVLCMDGSSSTCPSSGMCVALTTMSCCAAMS